MGRSEAVDVSVDRVRVSADKNRQKMPPSIIIFTHSRLGGSAPYLAERCRCGIGTEEGHRQLKAATNTVDLMGLKKEGDAAAAGAGGGYFCFGRLGLPDGADVAPDGDDGGAGGGVGGANFANSSCKSWSAAFS